MKTFDEDEDENVHFSFDQEEGFPSPLQKSGKFVSEEINDAFCRISNSEIGV